MKIEGSEDGNELACLIGDELDFHWEDSGIGSYEYWGSKGTDVQWGLTCEQDSIVVEFPSSAEVIPISGKATHTHGGCDGEHSGRCGRDCNEASVEVKISLISVTYSIKEDKYEATYSVSCE